MLSIRLTFEKSSAFQIFDILFIHAVGGRAFEVSVAISNNLPLPSALLLTVHRYPNPQGLSFKISVQCVIRIRDGSWIYYQKMTHSGRWTHVLGRRKVLTSWVGFSPVLLCTGAKVLGILQYTVFGVETNLYYQYVLWMLVWNQHMVHKHVFVARLSQCFQLGGYRIPCLRTRCSVVAFMFGILQSLVIRFSFPAWRECGGSSCSLRFTTTDLMKRSREHEGSIWGVGIWKNACLSVTFLRTRKSDHNMYLKVVQIDRAHKIRGEPGKFGTMLWLKFQRKIRVAHFWPHFWFSPLQL